MTGRRRRSGEPSPEETERLQARVAELEDRIRLLESHVRRLTAQTTALAQTSRRPLPKVPAARPRPRCPGCRLELPKGRRGEACVWCGFVFSAVRMAQD
jgi:hypothetical protein